MRNPTTPLAAVPRAADAAPQGDQMPPVVLDLGRTKKKLIKALKQGEGPLMEDVSDAVEAIRANLSPELDGKALIPVVIVYEKKSSRKRGFIPFGF